MQSVEKMGEKRRRRVKGGRSTAEAAAAASEGGQKLSTGYEGATEANLSNYVLLSSEETLGRIITEGTGGAPTAAGRRKGHSVLEEQSEKVHYAQEAGRKQGGAGGREGGEQQG